MNKEKIMASEVDEIIQSRFQFINRKYTNIRDAYKKHYKW